MTPEDVRPANNHSSPLPQHLNRDIAGFFDVNFFISIILLQFAFILDLLLSYSHSEENEVYIDVGENLLRSQPTTLLHSPSPSVIQSRNNYVRIPLSASPGETSYKAASSSSLYPDYEDYYYDDYSYDLGFPYQSIDKYQAQWGEAHERKLVDRGEGEKAIDQFIFPGQYVISQPHSSSTPYDRRLIIKLPDNSLTPPDQILGMMGISQHQHGNPVTYQNIVKRRLISQ